MAIEILGIRHHGVGSAIQVLKRLAAFSPDLVLIEGPPEIDHLLSFIGVSELTPPVSIMVYNENNPMQSSFYPYAEFSPEWVAAAYANRNLIPVKSIDLPAKISMNTNFNAAEKPIVKTENHGEQRQILSKSMRNNPMSYLARIAGFENSEKWWEYMFENNNSTSDAEDHFAAVSLAMSSLREQGIKSILDTENVYREAYMRTLIRKYQLEMYDNIAIICGAWHAPSLQQLESSAKADMKLIKSLPKSKLKLNASWIPWTNSRLSMHSGYGAGINSPGWYEHLWDNRENIAISWLSKVAGHFRKNGQDISTAHVLEAYRLAVALCQLRNKAHISIDELNESVLTVMCMGDAVLLELIKKEMIVNEKIGLVPDDIPKVPLQVDFEKTIKSLRLKLSAAPKDYTLDLRKANDLKRSILFHRLNILSVPWAVLGKAKSKGTFKELWRLAWNPAMMVSIIDKAFLGNTVKSASLKQILNEISENHKTNELSQLLQNVIPADLNDSVEPILNRIDELSAISSDIQDLLTALPTLIGISRYGDVRKSDLTILGYIVNRLLTKVCLGLPNACYGLDDEQSNEMFQLISKLQSAIKIHNQTGIWDLWHQSLHILMEKEGIHHIIQGCTCRLLLDGDAIDQEETNQKLSFALSSAHDPYHVASWIEGFLRGSGMLLIYDNRLWNLIYNWVTEIEEEVFIKLLPYLRRAFSKFEHTERKQIGQKAKNGVVDEKILLIADENENWNEERAVSVFDTLDMLMGTNKI